MEVRTTVISDQERAAKMQQYPEQGAKLKQIREKEKELNEKASELSSLP